MTTLRIRPGRLVPVTGDRIAADTGRACLAEWAAHGAGDDAAGGRAATLDRLAALTDYGAQAAALEILRTTGTGETVWNVAGNRAAIRRSLAELTAENPTVLPEPALRAIMREARRPVTAYEIQRKERDAR